MESGQAKLIQMKADVSLLLTYTLGPLEKKMSQCRKI